MRLKATMTEAELRDLAQSLVPLRIALSSGASVNERWLDIDELLDIELAADEGLELVVSASVRWPERKLVDEFRVARVELLLRPTLVATPNGAGLVITLRCRDIDVRWVPKFIDAAVVRRINDALARAGVELRWDFSDTLSFSFSETSERSNLQQIGFDVSTAELSVSDGALELEGPMQVSITRRDPVELEREALAALPARGEDDEDREPESSRGSSAVEVRPPNERRRG